jgi:hypothetical protein
MKETLSDCFEKRFLINDEHKIAAFLTPWLRNKKTFTNEERKDIKEILSKILNLSSKVISSSSSTENESRDLSNNGFLSYLYQ